ncbi:hypothetical protein N7493_009840 [Penicillium malachiteum]|uniref:Uncharacterized protein n=1 Tax=Penicillium malachiteum TaxID=1324776 RepID=A0AAD6HDJ2_9EURO|nr:hypothetical protein N7493_009840 [Penicillium malachiteum]
MRYDRVASSEDEEEVQIKATTQDLTPSQLYLERKGYQRWYFLGFAAIQSVVIVGLLVLVSVIAGRMSSLQAEQTHRSTSMIYGWDKPYMSLNHTYDHLWNETSSSGLVFTEVEGNETVGTLHCFADNTIEYRDVDENGEQLNHISGAQTSRQCRSAQAQALYNYRATHQYINPA